MAYREATMVEIKGWSRSKEIDAAADVRARAWRARAVKPCAINVATRTGATRISVLTTMHVDSLPDVDDSDVDDFGKRREKNAATCISVVTFCDLYFGRDVWARHCSSATGLRPVFRS